MKLLDNSQESPAMKLLVCTLVTFVIGISPALACCPACP